MPAFTVNCFNHFFPKTWRHLVLVAAAAFWGIESAQGAPLNGRAFHTAVWTGNEMILWSGQIGSLGITSDGGRYDPQVGSMTAMSSAGTPAARINHTAVWTGSNMIVWGGLNPGVGSFNNGGRYNPAADSWAPVDTNGAPTGRFKHTAIWTGSEMIVWGGFNYSAFVGTYVNDGGRYNPANDKPASDSWTIVSAAGAPSARLGHTAVWTGNDMIVWGGQSNSINFNDGGRYNPAGNTWSTLNPVNAPAARSGHTAVWTGNEMIVWGGYNGSYLNTGARYNPASDTWTALTTAGAPTGASGNTAVWTGSEMIVWCASSGGGRYNPTNSSWTAMNTIGGPAERTGYTAVWTGTEMIIWGGQETATGMFLNDGGRYNPATDTWTPIPASSLCAFGFPDNFACRETISGDNVSVTASNVGASKEAGEPNHGGNSGGHSLWWDWIAPYSGGVTVTTAGSDFDTSLGVYTGTNVSALTSVTSDGRANVPASATFAATAGVDYKIAVDGYSPSTNGATGNVLLNLTLQARPANDNFANRISIASGTVVTGQNLGATLEAVEPVHASVVGGKSVWWSWTATSNCTAVVTTGGSDFDTVVGVYTGTTLASLVAVATNDDADGVVTSFASFQAISGQNYKIAVDGYNRSGGNIVLQLQTLARPANDNFANATVLTGTNISATASNIFAATFEAGEPGDPLSKSLWWRWQAPASGGVSLDTLGSDVTPSLAVYTGSSVSALTQVDSGAVHSVFKAAANVIYRIALAGDGVGQLKLNLKFSPSPSNDDFVNAAFLGFSGTMAGSNVGATSEPFGTSSGNPFSSLPRPDSWGKDVWWYWVNPLTISVAVAISVTGSNFPSTISVYAGTSATNLTRITSRTGTTPTNVLWFNAVPHGNYKILVDGVSGAEGAFTINAAPSALAPTNDIFTNALALGGTSVFTTGQNVTATRETLEPFHAGIVGVGSVWWTWTSPAAGRLFVTTAGSSFTPLLAVYQGSIVSSLTGVDSAYAGDCPYFSWLDFDIAPASPQTYKIATDGASGAPPSAGSINLALTFVPKPVNDNFSLRTPLTGSFLVVTGSVIAATQEAGETVAGYSSGLRTVWYSWTAPTNIAGTTGGVTIRVTGINMNGTTNDPIVDVFQGNSLAGLAPVPKLTELFGNIRQVTFQAQAGATYQIAVAGGQFIGQGYENSFAQRTSAVAPDPLKESGTFLMRLNYSTLALRMANLIPSRDALAVLEGVHWFLKLPLGAGAQVSNLGNSGSGPVRVRLLVMNSDGSIEGDEGSFTANGSAGVATGTTATIPVNGSIQPFTAVLAVLEEQIGSDWFFRDSSILVGGPFGGAYGFVHCYIFSGGGVAMLEPGLSGDCFCPVSLTKVRINGPATVNEGSSAAYYGTAFFDNGTSPNFTNSIWSTSNTNKFPITSNGVLTSGNITSNTQISVITYFSYLGVQSTTNKLVTVSNLPPPLVTNLLRLPDRTFRLSLQGVPGRQQVLETTTNLGVPAVWSSLFTNVASQNGSLNFTDRTATNFNRRFYRTREN